MVSCTECVHYNACKQWVDHINSMCDALNDSYDSLGSALNVSLGHVTHLAFPMVAETKDKLCDNYDKAKLK